jgi:site-specific recombinase XerD
MLRRLEASQDIPLNQRIQWLLIFQVKVSNPIMQKHIQSALNRLKNQGKQAKYPVMPKIDLLIEQAFNTQPSELEELLDVVLVQLRLTTLMRSVDLTQVMWGLLTHDLQFFIKTTDKNAKSQVFNLNEPTLSLLLRYLEKHRHYPNLFMFRYIKQPSRVLSAQRLAKRVQEKMAQADINVQVFKSHSLRGATATHLLRKGCNKEWVKARGGWSSMNTLDLYYDRLHQHQDWASLLQKQQQVCQPAMGEDDEVCCRQPTASNAAVAVNAAYPEATKEAGGEAAKQDKAALIAVLSAHGIIKDMHEDLVCPTCGGHLRREATYVCKSCGSMFHVRCLASNEEGTWLQHCLNCWEKPPPVSEDFLEPGKAEAPKTQSHKDIIVDVMGVCDV